MSAAQLLRAFHDASAHCLHVEPAEWQFPPLEPVQVICHSDYAPYNCVFRNGEAVAIIDFDCARPGPRSWDLAYALYRFAPFMNPHNPDSFGNITEQSVRARKFLDSYGADRSLRQETVNTLTVRLRALTDFMRAAAQHDENFAHHIAQGHLAAYLNDIAYMENHEHVLHDVIVGPID
ncbi:phosphotransferase [Timonella sp. A28]|uniref:phosphotransferase n=1 Tax=Timonella sp. A28 TaxID=3442640 RepID=UPI003EB9834D